MLEPLSLDVVAQPDTFNLLWSGMAQPNPSSLFLGGGRNSQMLSPPPWRRMVQPNPSSLFPEADGTAKSFQPLPGGGRRSQILSPPPWRGDGAAGGWVNFEQLTAFGA